MTHPFRSFVLTILWALSASASALDLPPPAGSVNFGTLVRFLPNGNFVVVDPFAGPVAYAGAVHLYSPEGSLISTVRGDREGDQVGDGGIVVLGDGNFVILSGGWHSTDYPNGAAVTWVDASRGLSGVVSAANSLTGTRFVSAGAVFPLDGGDYAILAQGWTDDVSVPEKGAFLWVDGGAPTTGHVSAANALVGSRVRDGESAWVVRLANGNIVYGSASWSGTADARFLGATTFFSRTSRPVGIASSLTSLVGSHELDAADLRVFALTNGNYVVANSTWMRGGLGNAGAITWGDGTIGTRGVISEQNSMVGRSENDSIGFAGGVTSLANGDYVITSPFWHDDAGRKVGAATWVDGRHVALGEVSASNSLIGAGDLDGDGISAVALQSGNYVVVDRTWSSGGILGAGAITWADGTRPTSGIISASNSVVGTEEHENIGDVTPLANGNYVVGVPTYDEHRGAVEWMDGRRAPKSGPFSADHAIRGTTPGDEVGRVFPLSDGNYVIATPTWSNGLHAGLGAVTWADGNRSIAEPVSAANSLIGSHDGDSIGGCFRPYYCPQVTPLAHGAYLVSSPIWDDGDAQDVGAVTWVTGHAGLSGVVSAQNSLIGASANERFGSDHVTAFSDGMVILRTFTADLGIGIVVPRRQASAMLGVAGSGADDVHGLTPAGGNGVTFDYDASNGALIVGDPGSNFVTLRHLSRSTVPGHSRHARPSR